ncbi:hypothetical protein AN960_15020 [Bacillus sp. FJAT-25509]|nr:hypothetical protein AN960_15020 [Bacillus sp. FJAT-25509]
MKKLLNILVILGPVFFTVSLNFEFYWIKIFSFIYALILITHAIVNVPNKLDRFILSTFGVLILIGLFFNSIYLWIVLGLLGIIFFVTRMVIELVCMRKKGIF